MTGMELYVRFMFVSAAGILALAFILKTALETVFHDWDPVVDARRWWRRYSHRGSGVALVRAEDILHEIESRRFGGAPAREPSARFAPPRETETV